MAFRVTKVNTHCLISTQTVTERPRLPSLHHVGRSPCIRDAAEQAPFFKGWLNIPHFIELLINPGPLEGLLVADGFPFFRLDGLKDVLGGEHARLHRRMGPFDLRHV